MDHKLRYRRDGIVFPIPALSQDEAQRYRGACDWLESQLGGRPRTVEVRQMHLHFAWARDLATHERVLDAVEELLGPNLLVWATELFVKHPGDGITIGWHRDEDYTGFDAELSTTAWIALSESTPLCGCMQVVPGSHLAAGGPKQRRAAGPPLSAGQPVLDVLLRPGEISLHDGRVLHGSSANRSHEKRVGFVVRYVTPEARPAVGRPPALLARGADAHGHFDLVAPAVETDPLPALEGLRRSAAEHLDAVLENLQSRRVAP